MPSRMLLRPAFVGGLTYDALLARCALKANVETIYTWNLGHFQRWEARGKMIKTP